MNEGRVALQLDRLGLPLKKALHTAGRLSYDGVQINARGDLRPSDLSETALREIRRLLSDLNLRVGSIVLPTRMGLASRERIDARIAAIEQAMRMASRLQVSTLVTNLGVASESDADDRSTAIEVISQLASLGDRVGVEIALSASETETQTLAEFMADLPRHTVGVSLSPAELVRRGRSTKQFIERLGPRVKHVYANDALGTARPGESIETELGRGATDFAELLGMLEEYNYRGWLTVTPRAGAADDEELGNAVRFLRSF